MFSGCWPSDIEQCSEIWGRLPGTTLRSEHTYRIVKPTIKEENVNQGLNPHVSLYILTSLKPSIVTTLTKRYAIWDIRSAMEDIVSEMDTPRRQCMNTHEDACMDIYQWYENNGDVMIYTRWTIQMLCSICKKETRLNATYIFVSAVLSTHLVLPSTSCSCWCTPFAAHACPYLLITLSCGTFGFHQQGQ